MAEEEMGSLREKKLRERLSQLQKQEEYEAQVRMVLRKFLTDDAYERMMNVRISNKQLYFGAAGAIAQAASAGQVQGKISGERLKSLLAGMMERHETTLEIKKK